MASGLSPAAILNEYPERMARSLLQAALLRADLPPLWVQELFDSLSKALKK